LASADRRDQDGEAMSLTRCNDPARCRFWSEMIARYDHDRGEVVAYG
jgi:hypothetical protein